MKKITGILAAMSIGAALSVGTAAPALAGTVHPMSCPLDYGVLWSAKQAYWIPASSTYYKDGPGGTMTVSVTKASTISYEVSESTEVSGDIFFASAKQQLGASVTKTVAVTTGHTYSHVITSNKYGNMQYGTSGYTAHWESNKTNPNCTTTVLASGTAKWPVTSVGWKYWETSS